MRKSYLNVGLVVFITTIYLLIVFSFGNFLLNYLKLDVPAEAHRPEFSTSTTLAPEKIRGKCRVEASQKFVTLQNELCKQEGKAPNCVLLPEHQIQANEEWVNIENECNKL